MAKHTPGPWFSPRGVAQAEREANAEITGG
jgi:hypothetical protein